METFALTVLAGLIGASVQRALSRRDRRIEELRHLYGVWLRQTARWLAAAHRLQTGYYGLHRSEEAQQERISRFGEAAHATAETLLLMEPRLRFRELVSGIMVPFDQAHPHDDKEVPPEITWSTQDIEDRISRRNGRLVSLRKELQRRFGKQGVLDRLAEGWEDAGERDPDRLLSAPAFDDFTVASFDDDA